MVSVIQLPVHDTSYPRNVRVREFLKARGYDVSVVTYRQLGQHRPLSPTFIAKLRSLLEPFDIVIISEFQQRYTLPIKLAISGTNKLLIVDGFVGRYETEVEDWQRVCAHSLRSYRYQLVDHVARTQPDLYLIDTEVRAQDIRHRTDTPVLSLPVGSPAWARPKISDDSLPATNTHLKILYYGNYIPLHGFDAFVEALSRALSSGARMEVRAIGSGDLRPQAEALASRLQVSDHIDFRDPVPERELADHAHWSDVVLGIFGTSRKAETVIANKVWQGLSSGRRVLTRNSPALEELAFLPHDQIISTDPNVNAIATALITLAAHQNGDNSRDMSHYTHSHTELEAYVRKSYAEFGRVLDCLRTH